MWDFIKGLGKYSKGKKKLKKQKKVKLLQSLMVKAFCQWWRSGWKHVYLYRGVTGMLEAGLENVGRSSSHDIWTFTKLRATVDVMKSQSWSWSNGPDLHLQGEQGQKHTQHPEGLEFLDYAICYSEKNESHAVLNTDPIVQKRKETRTPSDAACRPVDGRTQWRIIPEPWTQSLHPAWQRQQTIDHRKHEGAAGLIYVYVRHAL